MAEGVDVERAPDELFDVFGLAHVQGRGVQAVEAFLPAHDEFHFLGFERGLDLVLELGHGRGIDAAAERAQRRGQVKVGHDVHRLRVFELGRGSELVDAFGERGDHGLASAGLRRRTPTCTRSAGIDADDGQEFLQRFEAAAGVVVAFRIVAVTRVTAGHEHPVGRRESRAFSGNRGLTRPEQGTRMIRRSVGWVKRATPAVSAPP